MINKYYMYLKIKNKIIEPCLSAMVAMVGPHKGYVMATQVVGRAAMFVVAR